MSEAPVGIAGTFACVCLPIKQRKRVEFGPDPFFFLRLDMEDCELEGCVLCSGDGCKLSPNSL